VNDGKIRGLKRLELRFPPRTFGRRSEVIQAALVQLPLEDLELLKARLSERVSASRSTGTHYRTGAARSAIAAEC